MMKIKYSTVAICFIISIFLGGMVYALNTADTGFRVNSGAAETTVDLTVTCSDCKKVTRTAAGDIFVPTKSCAEWNAFKANATGVALADCAGGPVPCPGTPTVLDADNNVYNTVQIGTQCWMKENLKVTKNPSGGAIARYCWNNDPAICNTEGGFYFWPTAMNGSTTQGSQGICAPGWHIPTEAEWHTLETYLWDGVTRNCDFLPAGFGFDCPPAGSKLKLAAFNGSDASGFGAVGTGWCDCLFGDFYNDRGNMTSFWSSSLASPGNAIYRELDFGSNEIAKVWNGLNRGRSVRCIKN